MSDLTDADRERLYGDKMIGPGAIEPACSCDWKVQDPKCYVHGADRLAAERERFEEWYVSASELHTEDDRTAAMLGWLAASGLSVLRRKVEPHEDREREATERDEHQDTYP